MSTSTAAIVCDTPDKINAYRLLSLKGMLKLETLGMRHSSGCSASKAIRAELQEVKKKAPRNKKKLLTAYENHLKEIGVLVSSPSASECKGNKTAIFGL
jgi:hypothetical protein